MTEPLRLFEGVGIELEYMIVDRETLAVRPIADELIRAECGAYESEIELGEIAWSNELVLHVVELKTNGPAPSLRELPGAFQRSVIHANALLEPMGARLMPTAMHPTMRPSEMRLWPHESSPIYETFHRIFDCRGHGWANLQSVHLNLPFGDDEEFGRLHAAIRLILPILPALAASSPIAEGKATGLLDTRLEYYRRNALRVPSLTGLVIPEAAFTRADYEREILQRIYDDLADHDPCGTLRHEWANARGCIARFDRSAIEIRLIDIGESPLADLAVAALVTSSVRALCEERLLGYAAQRAWETERLAGILLSCARDADEAKIDDSEYLQALGYRGAAPCVARDLWVHLARETLEESPDFDVFKRPIARILDHGCLARRILERVGNETRPEALRDVYEELCDCLATGSLF